MLFCCFCVALQFLWDKESVCGVLCLSVPENMNLEGVGAREEIIRMRSEKGREGAGLEVMSEVGWGWTISKGKGKAYGRGGVRQEQG